MKLEEVFAKKTYRSLLQRNLEQVPAFAFYGDFPVSLGMDEYNEFWKWLGAEDFSWIDAANFYDRYPPPHKLVLQVNLYAGQTNFIEVDRGAGSELYMKDPRTNGMDIAKVNKPLEEIVQYLKKHATSTTARPPEATWLYALEEAFARKTYRPLSQRKLEKVLAFQFVDRHGLMDLDKINTFEEWLDSFLDYPNLDEFFKDHFVNLIAQIQGLGYFVGTEDRQLYLLVADSAYRIDKPVEKVIDYLQRHAKQIQPWWPTEKYLYASLHE